MVQINIKDISSFQDKLSFVKRGNQREKIIKVLKEKQTPTQIRKRTGLSLNNVSDNLRLLDKVGIVKCLNEKQKIGRLYQLTAAGRKVRDSLE